MQPELQEQLSEIAIEMEKVKAITSDIFEYLSDKPEFLKYYQKTNYIKTLILLDCVNQALKEMEKLETTIKKERN